jgi:3-hydroxyisobutyrate dehydrogenase-like beta-hydroxyacid dehydrogenase
MLYSVTVALQTVRGTSAFTLTKALPAGAVVILASTISPSSVVTISDRLAALPTNISLVDAPISGGVARAAKGDLTIMASGSLPALGKAWPVLKALSGKQGKQQLHHVGRLRPCAS